MEKRRESKRGNRGNSKSEDKYSSGSDSGSSYYTDSDSDYEICLMTPAQRLREAIKSKQQDRKKGTYHEKENMDE